MVVDEGWYTPVRVILGMRRIFVLEFREVEEDLMVCQPKLFKYHGYLPGIR